MTRDVMFGDVMFGGVGLYSLALLAGCTGSPYITGLTHIIYKWVPACVYKSSQVGPV